MKKIPKFKYGDRVIITEHGRQRCIRQRTKKGGGKMTQTGTVVGGSHYGEGVAVVFDGTKNRQVIHKDFLEVEA